MTYIRVFVIPGAKKERVEEKKEALAIAVREPASANRANKRVCEIIALREGVPKEKVRILSGHRSRSKLISIAT